MTSPRKPRRHRRAVVGSVVLGVVAVTGACSASSSAPGPRTTVGPAAEPSRAPVPTTAPAGRVVRLPAGSAPEGVAVDPRTRTVVVALRDPDRVDLLSLDGARQRVRPVPGRARHLLDAAPGGPVLLFGEDTDRLVELALPSGRVERSVPLPRQPHNGTVVDGNIWVADELAGEISVVSPTGAVLATRRGPVQPGGLAAAAGRVGAVDVRGARMYFYDARTFAPEGSIAMGNGPTHALAVGGDDVVVADTRGGALLLVDMASRRIVDRLPLPGGPYGLAADPATGTVWVTLTASNQLVQVSASGGRLRVEDRTPTVQQPNTVAESPATGCRYVTGAADAQLQILCPAHPSSGP